MKRFYLAAPLLVVFAAGCSRVSTLTTLRADGGYRRQSVYTLSATSGMAELGDMASSAKDATFESAFSISKAGASVTKGNDGDDKQMTVARNMTAGAPPLTDVVLLDEKKKPAMTSTVTVRRLPTGELQYDERLKWLGSDATQQVAQIPRLREAIKAILPDRLKGSKATVDRVAMGLTKSMMHTALGPPYPLLFDFMVNPDAAKLRASGTIMNIIDSELKADVPEMNEIERAAGSRALISFADPKKMAGPGSDPTSLLGGTLPKGSDGKGSGGNNVSMTALLFEVAFPGKVVATNGLVDPVSGHVYWSLYAMAAGLGEVDLHLVVRP